MCIITTIDRLVGFALGKKLVPPGTERQVIGSQHILQWHPYLAQEVIHLEDVLVIDIKLEHIFDIANKEAELLIPSRVQVHLDHLGLESLLPKLQLHVWIAETVGIHGLQVACLDHTNSQPHLCCSTEPKPVRKLPLAEIPK